MDKAIVVASTEQRTAKNGNAYLEVIDQDGKKYGIFDQAKWNLFGNNAAVKLIGEYKGQFFNVSDAQSMADALPVTKTVAETLSPREPTPLAPTPQAVGMTTKELGDMIRASKLSEIFGGTISVELIKWYRGQILGTTRIEFDGAKLPQYGKKKEAEKPEPEETPF